MWLHFGLGDATITRLHIRWPDGLEQTFLRVPGEQRVTLAYPITTQDRLGQLEALYGEKWGFLPMLLGGLLLGFFIAKVINRMVR